MGSNKKVFEQFTVIIMMLKRSNAVCYLVSLNLINCVNICKQMFVCDIMWYLLTCRNKRKTVKLKLKQFNC